MDRRATFAQYFALAPTLLAMDRELDAYGCPVAYRKYIAADLLRCARHNTEAQSRLADALAQHKLDPAPVIGAWYNNIYGHLVYQPPAARFLATAEPLAVPVTLSPGSNIATLPDVTLIQYEIQEALANAIASTSPLLNGLKKLQALPLSKWVWLVMADYDTSITSHEQSRPAYHLSLWHTQQTLEKLLKAVLLARGLNEQSVRELGHRSDKILKALKSSGVPLSHHGRCLVEEIFVLCGGPSVRYADDSPDPKIRTQLAARSIQAHHLLLQFFFDACDELGKYLTAMDETALVPGLSPMPKVSDESLRLAVHLEHQSFCSHQLSSPPPYADRRDVFVEQNDSQQRGAG